MCVCHLAPFHICLYLSTVFSKHYRYLHQRKENTFYVQEPVDHPSDVLPSITLLLSLSNFFFRLYLPRYQGLLKAFSSVLSIYLIYLIEAAVDITQARLRTNPTLGPVVNENTAPSTRSRRIAPDVGVSIGETAMSALILNSQRWSIVPEFGAGKRVRCNTIFHPTLEIVDDVMRCNTGSAILSKHPRARSRNSANTAMGHAGDAKVSVKVVERSVVETHGFSDFEIVSLTVAATDERIGHAVVCDHLAAGVLEAAEVSVERGDIAVICVQGVGGGVVGLIHVKRVEAVVVEYGVFVPVFRDGLDTARELTQAECIHLGAVEEGREEEFAFGVVELGKDLVDSADLSVCKAAGKGGVVGAREDRGIEDAQGGIFENTIVDAIDFGVALIKDGSLNGDPVVFSQKPAIGSRGTSELHKTAAPCLKVIEVGCRRASNDAVKVVRVHLRRLHPLSTTRRATNIVRIVGLLVVKLADYFFASNHSRVTSAVNPIDNDFVVACEPGSIEGRTIVARIVTDSSKATTNDVVHVNIVDASVDTTVIGVHRTTIPLVILW